jgi:hypothetical protein
MVKEKWFGKRKIKAMMEIGLLIKLMDLASMYINPVFLLKNNY